MRNSKHLHKEVTAAGPLDPSMGPTPSLFNFAVICSYNSAAELLAAGYAPTPPMLLRALPFIRDLSHEVLYKEDKQRQLGEGEAENVS